MAEAKPDVVDATEAKTTVKKTATKTAAKKAAAKKVDVATTEAGVEAKTEAKVETKAEAGAETKIEVVATETKAEVAEDLKPVEAAETSVDENSDTVDIIHVSELIPEGFRPVLRPTNVADKPIGYIGCPKQIFDVVTGGNGWVAGINTNKYRTQLLSILFWYVKNGEAKVRCNSSSKFGVVTL